MDFISSEEFLKQSEKVQKVLKDWWKPEYGDLYIFDYQGFNEINLAIKVTDQPSKNCYILPLGNDYAWEDKELCMPLFTEGQLRKFIEEKTDTKVQIYYDGDYGYTLDIGYKDSFKEEHWGMYEKLGNDLLQAYWKVAVIIAKEG
ncbi:hypothetical protein [Clostridium kluyveri]|uniref:Uncharacterized protein n=1 Tax=Clostridium kluyveri TaxID=1534 RepID=A0A1L5F8X2_CLOKL|nr:hypothetical protein [Clostridium kluyveri]APM39432.1 hypothetical protein BS101_12100 [Clostridium kluyveri]